MNKGCHECKGADVRLCVCSGQQGYRLVKDRNVEFLSMYSLSLYEECPTDDTLQ